MALRGVPRVATAPRVAGSLRPSPRGPERPGPEQVAARAGGGGSLSVTSSQTGLAGPGAPCGAQTQRPGWGHLLGGALPVS